MRWIALVTMVPLAIACGGDDDSSGDVDGGGGGADAAPRSDAPPGAQWSARASLPGGPRQETAVVALDGDVYLIGGFDGSLGIVTDVWIYDVAGDSWSAGTPLPGPAHHIKAAVANDTIYLTGGLIGLGFDPSGFVLELTDTGWVDKTPMPAGTERGASAVGAVGNTIYVAGGSAGSSVATMSAYDVIGDEWTPLAPLPEPLDHLVGGVVDGTFYVIGGRNNGLTAVRSTVYEYDATKDDWIERAAMPTARGGSAAGVVGGMIIVAGGEGSPSDPAGVYPETEGYDPSTNSWTQFQDMRTPRHGTGAAGIGNQLFVPGGADSEGFGAVATHEVFTLR